MGEPWNTFVEGDNLDVLRALSVAGEKFDLIYIDPPYNTGSLFAYHDDRRGEDGRRASRHEAWVAMMRPRLQAARTVMSERAAIYVSIDDNEAAHLKVLMDEVFEERNQLAQIVVNLNPKGRQLGNGFATSHEYLLVYAKDARACALESSIPEAVNEQDFPLVTDDGRHYRRLPLRNTNKKFNPATARTLHFPVWGDPDTGRVAVEPFAGGQEIWPVFGDGRPAVWRWSAPLIAARPHDLMCRRVRGKLGERVDVYQRDWLSRDASGEARRKKLTTIWMAEEIGSTDTAVAELKSLVGPLFESPKPTGLIRRILATMPTDARVLDFFAGSGTTGHAVALANVEDGARRTCWSVQIAETTRPGSNAAKAEMAYVSDVTRARLRAVVAAHGNGGAKALVERDLGELLEMSGVTRGA
ncbi:site-specific DNA-methyltransferase [Nocardioides sp. NPDC006303]|uniref:site-specific DNA-methyltransferase n=1 Tax=Nocardioides sp. NPDC006303 TaxID=3156747 RepID=UPI0033BE1CC6